MESGNSDALAEAILKYLDDSEMAEIMGKACKMDLDNRLNWNTIAQQIKIEYDKLIE